MLTAIARHAVVFLCVLVAMGSMCRAEKARKKGLPFTGNIDAALEAARSEGKPVFLSWVAAWCPVCGQMKREAFRDPAMMELADRFV